MDKGSLATARTAPTVLDQLEAESIHILREVAAEFERPVMMYSVGKDSSVLLHLSRKAFYPGKIPYPLLHVDTGFKFPEMYAFRDQTAAALGLDILVHHSTTDEKPNPWDLGTVRCCEILKTKGLLQALRIGRYDAVIGGARREEERSRAKERVFSFRDQHGQWDPRRQRPELWSLYNGKVFDGESIRAFPLSDWTELDIWSYILRENIPVVPLYFSAQRPVINRNGQWIPAYPETPLQSDEKIEMRSVRYRTLGCHPCTGAVESTAATVAEIVEELRAIKRSERTTRVIDHDVDGSMERKKRDGYF